MCGIAGSINYPLDYRRIDECMGHRGPNERHSFHDGILSLYHLRLSIQDIAAGQQPMHYLNRYTIVFNGEIYNHLAVRKALGLDCITNSDTETILHAYHLEGASMLQRFDGMFAMAIYDKEKHTVFFARDRAGKKPLYFFNYNQQFVFASELNALRAILPLEIDTSGFADYMRMGSFLGNQTPYQHVQELPAGSYMHAALNSVTYRIERWWGISDYYTKPKCESDEPALIEHIDTLLQTAVKRRLDSSDLEVGSFLSGGIDSGLITAIAAQQHSQLQTFTVAFDGAFNEAPLAALVAKKYGTRHQELRIAFDDLESNVLNIIAQYGEPFFDSSAIPSWYVSKAAAKHLTVILNGDGADELFGGYRRYVPFARFDFFEMPNALRKTAALLKAILPPGHHKKSTYNFLYRLLSFSAAYTPDSIYCSATSDMMEDHLNVLTETGNIQPRVQQIAGNKDLSGLDKLMLLDFDINLFSDLLPKMDIATMAHSLEGRSPFLAKEILEWAPTLPGKYKIRNTTTKYLLRQLAAKYLPKELLHQPKRGFEVPLKDWVNGILHNMIVDHLQSADVLYPQIIQQSFVQALISNKVTISAEKRAKILWTIFSMEVWYQHQKHIYRPASASSLA